MPDVFTKAKRSQVMSLIRSRGNKETELALAILLRANKISGWRRHVKVKVPSGKGQVARKRGDEVTGDKRHATRLRGQNRAKGKIMSRVTRQIARPTFGSLSVRPDFVFPKARLAVFVDGCFWHGCPSHATKPKNNRIFWFKKLSGNKKRDRLVNRTLRRAGWRVIRIWQCALEKRPLAAVGRIRKKLIVRS